MRISERPPMPVGPPRRHERAHIRGRELRKLGKRRRIAAMLREETEELLHIALIGFERLGRHPPLVPDMREPAHDLGRHIGRGEGEQFLVLVRLRHMFGALLSHPLPYALLPFLKGPESARPIAMTRRIVDVLMPVAVDQVYSYRVPEGLALAPGDVVTAQLGARATSGVVWAENDTPNPRFDNRLKDIAGQARHSPVASRTCENSSIGSPTIRSAPAAWCCACACAAAKHLGPAREKIGVRLAGDAPKRMTAARNRVLELLADGMARAKSEAAHEAGVSAGVIDGLIDDGTLETLVLPPEPVAVAPNPDHQQPEFTDAQRTAADALRATIAKGGYSVTLIDGVTGSGKTEVYFEAVAETLRRGRQVMILMPEIALTGQFLDRFAARFGVPPAEWHSQLSPRKRARTWSALAAGEVKVVVGARSALFLPYADLGLIIVDEEHDPAYKQEDGVRYHARDMAVVRAREAKIPVVLASATPSVETEVNARRGRYARLHLPERFGGSHLPAVEAIDLAARRSAARPLHRAAPRRRRENRAGERRAGAALSQSPRLCAAHAVQCLRPPARLPELRCLAGRSPLQAPPRLSPLRLRHAASRQVPEMPGDRKLRRGRSRRRTAGKRGGRVVSQ